MKRYLLPCSCSSRTVVTAAQAGGAVCCPACAATLAVPRLRDLGGLEVAGTDSPDPTGRGWDTGRACLLVGAAATVLAAVLAIWLRAGRAGLAPLDEQAIRVAVAAAGSDQVYAAWLEFERQGVARPPAPEERRRLRQAQALWTLEKAAWIVAVTGCIAAVAGAVFAVRRGRRHVDVVAR